MKLYHFIWHEFCDWYIELSKEPLKAGGERQAGARWVLINVFDKMLRLLHPFMPFVSEEIWQVIRPYLDDERISRRICRREVSGTVGRTIFDRAEAARDESLHRGDGSDQFAPLTAGWHPGQRVPAVVRTNDEADIAELKSWQSYATTLGKLASLQLAAGNDSQHQRAIAAPLEWGEVGIEPPADFDFDIARPMLKKQLDEVSGHLDRHRSRYENPGFRAKADAETVADIAERIEELQVQQQTLEVQIGQLS